MKLWWLSLSSALLSALFSKNVWAAACCGGGFSTPSIIAGDDKAQFTTSYSLTEVVVDSVDSQGLWYQWEDHQRVTTFKIEGAHIFKDVWQVGFSIPVIQRSAMDEVYSGLGDVATSVGYEYLSDWNYNPYRPKGIGFVQAILPTGKSKASSEVGGLDSRGNGFWALGVGTLLTKAWGRWDAFTSLEAHRSFEKEVNTSVVAGTLKPGFGGNYTLGLGFNFKDYRVGSSLSWTYEDPIAVETSLGLSKGVAERYATAAATLSYLASQEWSGSLSYSDQTLFGSPLNTSLGKTVLLQIQRRWSR